MKIKLTRSLSLIMALILCVGLLFSTTTLVNAQTVDYVYANYNSYSKIIKNWGTREQDATFLSQNAITFYADNDTSYDELAALAGSSNLSQTPSSALYKELQELMKSNHKTLTSYGEIRYLSPYTDCQNSAKTSTQISSLYSGSGIGPSWDAGKTWNREHCWPKSKTAYKSVDNGDRNEATDIMTVRPSASSENTSRSNKAYGTATNSSYFFPNNFAKGQYDLRGDCARMMLYTYVRWGNTSYMWGSTGVIQSKEILLQWMAEDPVDTWELGRNDSVESITGTRNVFVDYPELVFVLFDAEIPDNYTTPSGEAKGSPSGSTTPSQPQNNTPNNNNNTQNNTQNNNTQNNNTSKPTNTNTACKHPNIQTIPAEEPRCDLDGYTEGKYCPDCNKYINGHKAIAAPGHTYLGDCDATCEACGNEREVIVAHTFVDGVCRFCNAAEETEDINSELTNNDIADTSDTDKDAEEGGFKWWIVFVVAGGVLLIGGAVVLFVFREKIWPTKIEE